MVIIGPVAGSIQNTANVRKLRMRLNWSAGARPTRTGGGNTLCWALALPESLSSSPAFVSLSLCYLIVILLQVGQTLYFKGSGPFLLQVKCRQYPLVYSNPVNVPLHIIHDIILESIRYDHFTSEKHS